MLTWEGDVHGLGCLGAFAVVDDEISGCGFAGLLGGIGCVWERAGWSGVD